MFWNFRSPPPPLSKPLSKEFFKSLEYVLVNCTSAYFFSGISCSYIKRLLRYSKMFYNFLISPPPVNHLFKNTALVHIYIVRSIFSPIFILLGSVVLAAHWLWVSQGKVFYTCINYFSRFLSKLVSFLIYYVFMLFLPKYIKTI